MTRRLSLNLGLRWEFFGVLGNTDPSKDVNFYAGSGATPEERLKNGVLRRTTDNPGDLKGKVHRPDFMNLAPSAGLAWDPFGKGTTVFRAGYALAFDRIYDTARDVRTNSVRSIGCAPSICNTVLLPIERMLALVPPTPLEGSTVAIDENLRTPYAQNWYLGVQQNLTKSLVLEVGHSGSAGRRLVSRDVVNREELSAARTNDDDFITNQGSSNYAALETALRQRLVKGLQYQVSYTWSHAIDNQSDLLEGVRFGPDRLDVTLATFTRALDPGLDRGSANFDQRHNLVLNWIWDIPAPRSHWDRIFGGWSVSGIGAHRSGFPVTAIASRDANDPEFQAPGLRFNRLDLVGDAAGTAANRSCRRQALAIPGGLSGSNRKARNAGPQRVKRPRILELRHGCHAELCHSRIAYACTVSGRILQHLQSRQFTPASLRFRGDRFWSGVRRSQPHILPVWRTAARQRVATYPICRSHQLLRPW